MEGALQGAALEAEDITRLYKGTGRGVSGVSFSVAPGEIYGLMGPNGSGKSTLLRILSTSLAPDSGSFKVFGDGALSEKRKVRSRMGLMVDKPTHYGDLSGWVNAYLFARLYGLEEKKAEASLAELFDYFDLAEFREDRAKAYSYGMGPRPGLPSSGRALARARLHLAASLPAQGARVRRLRRGGARGEQPGRGGRDSL
jgi:ABC-2 type transport system ATP-binding protein